MRRTTALRGAAALIALLPAAAMAERGADGHLNIIYYQAPSILNPYLSGPAPVLFRSFESDTRHQG
ncbi:hypothetical protein, partial [Haematobacter missouriensis]|uniref:hypothetical protein n=1 Tax=Haematobacter missouriensis TaxID=366616 RepID=UPI0023F0CBCD